MKSRKQWKTRSGGIARIDSHARTSEYEWAHTRAVATAHALRCPHLRGPTPLEGVRRDPEGGQTKRVSPTCVCVNPSGGAD